MSLLREIEASPVDPAYAANAARRERRGQPRSTSLTSVRVGVIALGVGLLLGVSAAALNADRSGVVATRQILIDQIDTTRAEADTRAATAQSIQGDISRLESAGSPALSSALADLERAIGTVPVTGPGIRVTIDDAPAADAAASGNPDLGTSAKSGRVLARDVQIVVNSLWRSGAEAVAVNGQRIGSQTAIRFAGDAILVNFRPLNRPYVISAIGDPKALPTAFMSGDGGAYLSALHGTYGIVVDMAPASELSLPGVTSSSLRYAKAAGPTKAGTTATSTATTTKERP
ncbi:MAG: DUF881 domain-containing protein [Nostocoides sp.]